MASKIAIRILLIAALVVTAHTIKPFSFTNIAFQALGAARSLSFALPETTAERIEHAYYLAQTYGKGLFDDDSASLWTKQSLFRSELVTFANLVELDDNAEIKDVRSGDSSRKPAQKRATKRIKRDENRDEDSSCSKNEISQLPEVRAIKTVALVPPRSVWAYQDLAMTWFYTNNMSTMTNIRVGWLQMAKPAILTSTCRDAEPVKLEIVEAPDEITTGPEEDLFFAEPNQIPSPIPTVEMPECIRIP